MENNMLMGRDSALKDFITQYSAEEIVFSAFFFQQVLRTNSGKMLLNFGSLVQKYLPEIKAIKKKVTLSEEEYRKYKFNPKRLSYDIYGTTELWFLILDANELYSTIEFDLRTLYLYKPSIVEKMGRILNLEKTSKDYNAAEVTADLNAVE